MQSKKPNNGEIEKLNQLTWMPNQSPTTPTATTYRDTSKAIPKWSKSEKYKLIIIMVSNRKFNRIKALLAE